MFKPNFAITDRGQLGCVRTPEVFLLKHSASVVEGTTTLDGRTKAERFQKPHCRNHIIVVRAKE